MKSKKKVSDIFKDYLPKRDLQFRNEGIRYGYLWGLVKGTVLGVTLSLEIFSIIDQKFFTAFKNYGSILPILLIGINVFPIPKGIREAGSDWKHWAFLITLLIFMFLLFVMLN